MVKSNYISNILNLLLDGKDYTCEAKKQLPFIEEDSFEYTGVGLFVYFKHSNGIIKHRLNEPDLVLDGVKIQSHEYSFEADAILFFKEGLINYLEIWCYAGNEYPKQDLKKYTLRQVWENSGNKTISTEV